MGMEGVFTNGICFQYGVGRLTMIDDEDLARNGTLLEIPP
jgi:hypothetical protein